MKIYLLFLFAILITCRANEVSRSRQLNANFGFRRNDLNRGAYINGVGGYGDRNIGRTAYIGEAGLEPVYVGKTTGFNHNSYERRASDPSRGDNVRAVTPLFGKLPTRTKNIPNAWRVRPNKGAEVGSAPAISNTNLVGKATLARASKVDKDTFVWNPSAFGNDPKEGRVVRQTRDLLGRASGVDPATHIGSISNVVQGVNLRTSDHKRAGGYGQGNYINRPDGLHQVDNARRNIGIPIVRDGYNVANGDDGINISDRGSTGNFNNGFDVPSNSYSDPNNGNGVFNDYRFHNIGYDYVAPYEGYGNPNDGSYIPNNSFGVPNNRFGGSDYNMLAPDFYNLPDIEARINNNSTNKNIYSSSITDKIPIISNRGGIFDDGYSVSHRLIHDSKIFPDYKHGDTSIVEISNNYGQMNSNGDCYCDTNNGQHNNHIKTTTITACEICKVRETTTPKPIICDQNMIKETLPPPPSSSESASCICGHSTSCCCMHSCHCGNSCSNNCCSEPKKPTYYCCEYSNRGGGGGGGGAIIEGAGTQVHTMVDGGAWGGVYGGGSGQITHGHSAFKHSGSNGGTVALNTDFKFIDDIKALLSSNNGVQISGGGSSAAADIDNSSTGYGGGRVYKKFFTSFGKGPFSKKFFQGAAFFGG